MKNTLFFIFIIQSFFTIAQKDTTYYSIDEALIHPELVYNLDYTNVANCLNYSLFNLFELSVA